MRKFLLLTLMSVSVCFAYSQITFAACGGGPTVYTCDTADPNPDPTGIQEETNDNTLTVNVLPGAGIDTASGNGGSAIDLGDGGNTITVDNGNLIGADDAVESAFGNDMVDILGSDLTAGDDCVETSSGNDTVNMTDTTCLLVGNAGDGLELASGNDTASVLRSTITCNPTNSGCEAIEGGNGEDDVTVVESALRGGGVNPDAIALGGGNDIATLGTGSNLEGLIDCGSNFDTLIFAMDVPEEAVGLITSQILAAGLPDGSISINNLFYEWENCELLVPQLNGVQNVRPIPTLSEWGLIAMAGVLGLVGLLAVRRKKVTA